MDTTTTAMNQLMVAWAISPLPSRYHKALVCCAGSLGYTAFKRSLSPSFPQQALVFVSNIDNLVDGVPTTADDVDDGLDFTPEGAKYFCRLCTVDIVCRNSQLRRAIGFHIDKRRLPPINLTVLANYSFFGNSWGVLAGCSGLQSINLEGVHNVTSIGGRFLESCSGLKEINLSPFVNITDLHQSFLYGCSGLTSLDLGPLRNVTDLGSSFLHGCSGLTSLDLSPLSKVTKLYSFLTKCSGLTSIDFTPLVSVTVVSSILEAYFR